MIAKACQGKNTLLPFTNGDFSQTFNRQWAGFPRGIGCHRVPGFILLMARFIHNNINSKEVCRVFVLRCQSASNLTCPVWFRRVTCHMQFTWSFIHACIHASKHQYFHTFTHSSVHNAHIHTISIHTWLHQSPRVLFGHTSSIQSSILSSGES